MPTLHCNEKKISFCSVTGLIDYAISKIFKKKKREREIEHASETEEGKGEKGKRSEEDA